MTRISELECIGLLEAEEIQSVEGPNLQGIALGGSVGRGEAWIGSDVDLYVIVKELRGKPQKLRIEYPTLIDETRITDTRLQNLQDPSHRLTEYVQSSIPDELYGCRVIYDPQRLLQRFTDYNEANLLSKEVVEAKHKNQRGKAERILETARQHLLSMSLRRALVSLREAIQELAMAKMIEAEGMRKGLKTIPDRMKDILDTEFCTLHQRLWGTGMTKDEADRFYEDYYLMMFDRHVSWLEELFKDATDEWKKKNRWETLEDFHISVDKSKNYNDLVYKRLFEADFVDSGIVLVRSFLIYFPEWSLSRTYHESKGLKPPALDPENIENVDYLPTDMVQTYLRLEDFGNLDMETLHQHEHSVREHSNRI